MTVITLSLHDKELHEGLAARGNYSILPFRLQEYVTYCQTVVNLGNTHVGKVAWKK